ncbi:MAG: glutathione ABC transporter permease GsiC [Treponema sp. GWB1_62_6]|nr:MAG: glutathione ABC transporter permease GsiC [Treponema sp. GWC1_61_84]OHE68863.1 MAG: glutathione ABC transporter permease GsiC [Treponema sp. RIFOXYC1_FULL_61_9]OHE70604.1 MAG: glutathione ABC transporter permease GsiC [Treponema sp. GWB1_62_6]HCM25937.1 glutathione ABC transporter permease GsiC [Treponema sp.]
MGRYIIRRLLSLIPVLLGVSIIVFFLVRLIPGSALQMYLGTQVEATAEQMVELQRLFGEDKPVPVLYVEWLGRIMTGDFGHSLRTGRAVLPDILSRLPLSLEITLMALVLALAIGVPLGVLSSLKQRPFTDITIRVTGLLGLSLPQFWLAALMVMAFSGFRGWIPMGNFISLWDDPVKNLRMLFLPSLAIGIGLAAVIMRYTRNSMLEVLQSDYIRTAKAKGLSRRTVIVRHALRNAILPVITVAGFNVGYLLGGAIVIEEVFALPGMGRLALYAIYQRDYPVIQAIVLLIATLFVVVNLITDLIYALVDPRIRLDEKAR